MSHEILRADARRMPLADKSVDLIVTSPPYYGLRSYQDGGKHYAGQLGSEPTPAEFVAALIECTREMVRVLKPFGSIWINLGDKYATHGGHTDRGATSRLQGRRALRQQGRPERRRTDVPTKSLHGIPWRYALQCIDDLGLTLRAEVIWSKPNALPESVTDRVRRSHEQWFHFTVSPHYYSALDEIREPHSEGTHTGRSRTVGNISGDGVSHREFAGNTDTFNPLGKLPGSVWEISTQPLIAPAHLDVDHYAAFPMEWPRRIIRGWSPAGICTTCGEGRRPAVERTPMKWRPGPKAGGYEIRGASRKVVSGTMLAAAESRIVGETCSCPDTSAPTRPAVVLDPFGGTGTTALVADVLGRHGINIDMSADYCRLAAWRCADPGERARAMQVEKPPAVMDGQLDLFDVTA